MVLTDGVRRVLDGGVYADPSVAPLLAVGTRVTGTGNRPSELSCHGLAASWALETVPGWSCWPCGRA